MNVVGDLFGWLAAFVVSIAFELLFLIALLVFAVLIAGVLAPLGTLRWWAGWTGQHVDDGSSDDPPIDPPAALMALPAADPRQPAAPRGPANHYIVYLSGIGDISADFLQAIELGYVNALAAALPQARIIDDIFAYSVTNIGLTEEALMGRFWRWMKAIKLTPGRRAAFGEIAINGRNLLQVAVSADRRYGPVFNYGTANTIYQHLIEVGYQPGQGVPVTLIGYSGGGQVVLASSQYLKPVIGGPLQVISVGGVMADSPGVAAADEIVHLHGRLDPVQAMADYLFPARWKVARRSRWNQAIASGKIRRIDLGPIQHNGPHGYYGPDARLPDGRTHLEATVGTTVDLVNRFQAAHP